MQKHHPRGKQKIKNKLIGIFARDTSWFFKGGYKGGYVQISPEKIECEYDENSNWLPSCESQTNFFFHKWSRQSFC